LTKRRGSVSARRLNQNLKNNPMQSTGIAAGGEEWYVPIEIHVFRPKLRLAKAAESFWQHIAKSGG
jgi:hypothetical protein